MCLVTQNKVRVYLAKMTGWQYILFYCKVTYQINLNIYVWVKITLLYASSLDKNVIIKMTNQSQVFQSCEWIHMIVFNVLLDVQRWRWEDRCIYHSKYSIGEDALWRSGRHLPDRQDVAYTKTSHGADRGKLAHCNPYNAILSILITPWFLSTIFKWLHVILLNVKILFHFVTKHAKPFVGWFTIKV